MMNNASLLVKYHSKSVALRPKSISKKYAQKAAERTKQL